jgi:hypothetical protein
LVKEELVGAGGNIPGLIVRHTSRRLGRLTHAEACGRVISGEISFSEFVDQVGDGFRELLDFMIEHDLHPGRPVEVLDCLGCYANLPERRVLRDQLRGLYLAGWGAREGKEAS